MARRNTGGGQRVFSAELAMRRAVAALAGTVGWRLGKVAVAAAAARPMHALRRAAHQPGQPLAAEGREREIRLLVRVAPPSTAWIHASMAGSLAVPSPRAGVAPRSPVQPR